MSAMTRWEYRHYVFEAGEKMLDKLNQLGAEGWEAFHFTYGKSGARVLFKRPKPTTPEEKTP
jgi:hypothetical protein